jgi:predicted AlkP superfamily pyrophosphatase or phosphodiesterase
MIFRRLFILLFAVSLLSLPSLVQDAAPAKPKPRVIVIGVNGLEWDILRPLLVQGELANLAFIIKNGVHGKLRTVSVPTIIARESIARYSRARLPKITA